MNALGDLIGGSFTAPTGESLRSTNPVDGTPILETAWDPAHVDRACEAAQDAYPIWRDASFDDRLAVLHRFREAIRERKDALAEAISLEIGKVHSEAHAEVGALLGRFDIIEQRVREDLRSGHLPGHPDEALRYHPHGVVGVVGPFNFPLHLCHAHVVPALLLGNTVVMKASEVAPLAAQRYAEAAVAAGLPEGVLNVVQGGGAAGAALTQNRHLRALAFTGSWPTGRRILESLLDRPEVLLALEMGGKNTCIVAEDADLRQAAHEIIVGGYLTTGQRCTCTDRVLVHRKVKDRLVEALAEVVRNLDMGRPDDPKAFAGPLATAGGLAKLREAIAAGEKAGAEEVARGTALEGGNFVAPTLHVLPDGVHEAAGYTDTELFGPDVHVEAVADDDEAIATLNASHFGFANSIFTASEARYHRYFRETSCGLLNWNRSTNQASPRLPFGGTGQSGNFRPAGAWAPRNLVFPVASRENLPGGLTPDPRLEPLLPEPDLDALEGRHAHEEAEEAQRNLVDAPRPLGVERPRGGHLPQSDAWLARLYAGDRLPKEKKPGVFDHLRSVGPWFVSVDDEPLSVLDGMSQTATVCEGFGEPAVVRRYVEGGFGDTILSATDTSVERGDEAETFAGGLRRLLPGLPYVSFVNGGSEAVEKALALCRTRARSDKQKRVLAFEGSFHGRTLLSLHASFNPAKRAPFEIAGHGVTFAPFPVWWDPHHPEPAAPEGYLATVARGRLDEALDKWGSGADGLLGEEVRALAKVHESLQAGTHFAVIVEPMQSEGGDRYATARFFRALRLLTRHHGVPLVFDEVQTGFGLGGTFAWHSRFDLIARDGNPDGPDCVTFAKRAQVGVVMSRFEDPEPTCSHGASLVRGLVHAEMMAEDDYASVLEERVRKRLSRIARRYPELVLHPRNTGYALAFDLPTPEHLAAYLGQRWWRGAIVFGAGSRTVRYRLGTNYGVKELNLLFDAIRRSLSWLDAHPGQKPPAWIDLAPPVVSASDEEEPREEPEIRVRRVERGESEVVLADILRMEERVYEPARRDPPDILSLAFEDEDGIAVIAEAHDGDEWTLVGCALAVPLEHVSHVGGVDRDPMLGRENTLYSLALTVDPGYRGFGIGRRLKHAQLEAARKVKRSDGTPRYLHAAGRNRVGKTAPMMRVNHSLGAYEVYRLTGVYDDPEAQALYYRLPTGAFRSEPPETPPRDAALDFAGGLSRPLATPPESLREARDRGLLYGPTVNKLTLCNYVTPAIVRGVEWVSSLRADLPHLFLTSSRDECFDKAVRALRFHRSEGQVVIGLEGGYVGHTTAAARSLSDPAVHRQGPGYFEGWPRVPHPAADPDATLAAIRQAVEGAGGPERVIGVFVEPVQERTGRVVPEAFWPRLAALREELGVPVVLVEHATAAYRSGGGPFASSGVDFQPDILAWWGGGQVGFLHVAPKWFVPKPLTLVSTWDGDELSLIRVHHQLRAARRLDVGASAAELDAALEPARKAGLEVRGTGLYRVIDAGRRAPAITRDLEDRGVRLRRFANDHLSVVPPLDLGAEGYQRFGEALASVLEKPEEGR